MQPKMIIRFRSGSKKDTVAEFPLEPGRGIRFGVLSSADDSAARSNRPEHNV